MLTVYSSLSDMDGTLVDSHPAVTAALSRWARSQGIEPAVFFTTSHGVRTRDNIKRFQTVPVLGSSLTEDELDVAAREIEYSIAEEGRLLSEAGKGGIVRLPGIEKFLAALQKGGARWGIVTSGGCRYIPATTLLGVRSRPQATIKNQTIMESYLLTSNCPTATIIYASSALTTSGVGKEPPAVPFLITADNVRHGKPHPEPYLAGLEGQ